MVLTRCHKGLPSNIKRFNIFYVYQIINMEGVFFIGFKMQANIVYSAPPLLPELLQ